MLASMSSAVFVWTNGLGSSLLALMTCPIAYSSWEIERCVPRRMYFGVSIANHRST